ncbi:MAG: Amidohydrolase [Ignavibacteria bacterium]|nr:Amidohydrolase [Ignavibacteria bacterium]
MEYLTYANSLIEKLIRYRRHIHAEPELSFNETNTSAYVRSVLDELKIPNQVLCGTAVIGQIGDSGKCVALRADMDALQIEEETGLEFASKNPSAMHACGHDMHTAMLLGAAEILSANKSQLNGTVKFIFQHAEEKLPGGAKALIEHGVLENPEVSAVFGQHVNPFGEVGSISLNSGPILASADELYWTITGKGCHAAQPHLGSDPILAASGLIQALHVLVIKEHNPLAPVVLSVTSIHGGTATNIFPDTVQLMGTLRTFNEEIRAELHEKLQKFSSDYCALFGTKSNLRIEKGYPPLVNAHSLTDFISSVASEVLGSGSVEVLEPKMWAEDFAYYAKEVPSVFWFLGVRPKNMLEMPPLHNSRFAPDESALPVGAAMLASAAMEFLKNG